MACAGPQAFRARAQAQVQQRAQRAACQTSVRTPLLSCTAGWLASSAPRCASGSLLDMQHDVGSSAAAKASLSASLCTLHLVHKADAGHWLQVLVTNALGIHPSR